jgi:MFS transporter, PPP family, 3-phenylpropionic acid transporter
MSFETSARPVGWGLYLRLSGFYGAMFLVSGLTTPLWPVFLDAKGMNASEIGILLALTTWTRAAASPAAAAIADRTGHLRLLMVAATTITLLLSGLFFVAEGFWLLLLISMVAYFTISAVSPLGEAITLRRVSVRRDYGRIRLWGSVTFIVSASLGGWLLDVIDAPRAEVILVMILIAVFINILGCAAMPDERPRKSPVMTARLRALLRNRPFMLVIAATSLIHGSHMFYYGFGTLYWLELGLSTTVIGLLWAEGVVAEILLFAFGARLCDRLGVAGLLGIAAACAAVRWAIMPMTTEIWVFALIQLLHAASFGAMHLGAMRFITQALPESHAVAGQSLYSGITNGVALGAVFLVAGWLYGAYAGASFYSGSGFALLGLVSVIALRRCWRRGEVIALAGDG